jgi:hypothetical protein
MKPIYFPFTHVSDSVAVALTACFGQFVVYRPLTEKVPAAMQSWIDLGALDVRVPAAENEKELETAIKNYLNWADLHISDAGKRATFLNAQRGGMPFFDDFSPSKLVADIKAKLHRGANQKLPDPVLAARIFLYFAQEFDRQNQELACDLKNCHQKEADLIRQLKMEADSLADELQKDAAHLPDPLADYMISDRLEAWSRIFLKDPNPSGLFVTHSPAVLDHLLDNSQTAAEVMHYDAIPLSNQKTAASKPWQESLILNFMRLAQDKPPASSEGADAQIEFPAAEETITLTAYLVPGQTPRNFFSRCARINPQDADDKGRPGSFNNTLIALVEL